MGKKSNPALILAAFFSIYVIWGSTYLLNKIAVSELPPFMLASIRFITAGILIFLICRVMRVDLRVSGSQLKNSAIAGFLFLSLGNGLVVWALRFVDTGFAALEISAQPLLVLILMKILHGKKIKSMSIVGIILGMFGIYLLVSQQQVISQENSILGMIMIFIALLSWAYGSLFVSSADLPSNYLVNTGYQMVIGGIIMLIVSLVIGEEWMSPENWTSPTIYSMILLVIFGSIVAFTSFNYLLKVVSPEKVSTSTYVNPIIALLLGWYFLGEVITLQSIIAAVVLLTGVYFINTRRKLLIFSRFSEKPVDND